MGDVAHRRDIGNPGKSGVVIVFHGKCSVTERLFQFCEHIVVVVAERPARAVGGIVNSRPERTERGRHDVPVFPAEFKGSARQSRQVSVARRINIDGCFYGEIAARSTAEKRFDSAGFDNGVAHSGIIENIDSGFRKQILVNALEMLGVDRQAAFETADSGGGLKTVKNFTAEPVRQKMNSIRTRHENRYQTRRAHTARHCSTVNQQDFCAPSGSGDRGGDSRRARPYDAKIDRVFHWKAAGNCNLFHFGNSIPFFHADFRTAELQSNGMPEQEKQHLSVLAKTSRQR